MKLTRRMLTRRLALAVSVTALALAGPALAQGPTVMKLGTPTLNDGQHEFLKRFAAAIEKESQGKIKPEIYPASQLGPIPRQIEATQLGAVQGFLAPAEFFDGVDPRFQVLTAPGVFTDMDHVDRVLRDAEFRKAFYALGGNRGLRVGTLFLSGPADLNTRVPVKQLSDMKGLKLRVLASPMQMEPTRKLGASGIPMTLGEVLPALQQGTIDGTFGSIPVFTALRYYDAAKYFTKTSFAFAVSMFTISKIWLEKLPADQQKLIVDTAATVGDGMHPFIKDFYQSQSKVWVERGGQIFDLTADDRAKGMADVAAVGKEVIDKDKGLKEIYDVMSAAAGRTKK